MALTTLIPNVLPPFTKPQTVSYINNGISTDVNRVKFPLQTGVPVQPIYTFKVIPAPLGANVTIPYTTTVNPSGFTLSPVTTTQGTAPNIQVKPIVFLGQNGALLDCERCLIINFSVASSATTIATLRGYDYRGVAIEITTPTIGTTLTSYQIPTALTVLTSISFSANPLLVTQGTITVTTDDFFGFPYLLTSEAYVIAANWDGESLLPGGTEGIFIPGYKWRTLGPPNPNSSARGFWAMPTDSDGVKEFIMTAYFYGADSEIDAEINNLNQSTLKIVGVQLGGGFNEPVLPYLVSQDLTGIQIDNGDPFPPTAVTAAGFAGDSAFFFEYFTKVNS